VPTGTVENDVYQQYSGSKLGITTQNGWIGYVDGNEVSLYVGALEWEPDQGAFYLFFSIPNDFQLTIPICPRILTHTRFRDYRDTAGLILRRTCTYRRA
jgi:hypothetical protein